MSDFHYHGDAADIEIFSGQEVTPHQGPSMVIISLAREVPVEVDLTWLLSVLPEGPRVQIDEASLVIVTDPGARLCHVIKNEADQGDMLEIHTAAIG